MSNDLEPIAPKERPPWLRKLLKALLVFHVFAIISWTLPETPEAIKNGNIEPGFFDWPQYANEKYIKWPIFSHYILTTGTWQSWDMFSRNPSNRDTWGSAEIEFADHTVQYWEYPRVKSYGYFWKYEKERFRKYFERVNLERYYYLWPDLCLWIARQHNTNPANPPVKVRLYRHMIIIPPIPAFGDYWSNLAAAARGGRLSVDVISPKTPTDLGPYVTTLLTEQLIEREKL